MRKSIFYYKELTPAEVGKTGTHEVYVRLPNNFDYKSFFHQDAIENGSVLEINFSALDITNGRSDAVIEQFRFVYFANSNKEKRLPGLGPLFKRYDIQSGDIFFLESREENGQLSFEFKFIEKGSIMLQPSQIYFSEEYEDEIEFEKPMLIDNSLPLQQIFYGAPGTGKSHTINEITKKQPKENVYRTTFHPDSDYSTFVGCYKPSMKRPEKIYTEKELTAKLKEIKESGVTYPCHKFATKYWESLKDLDAQSIKNILSACGFTDSMAVEVSKGIAIGQELLNATNDGKIVYDFSPQAFTKAYLRAWQTEDPVYLVIEEINRGNCAQIFGDLFQLLDRKNGFSEYPIKADNDLAAYIGEQLSKESREGIFETVKSGEELILPPNLFIWATMNTSDQSLFPIDSAFKRRWDWQYIPISDGKKGWKIEADGKRYDWWQFLQKMNDQIGSTTNSEDKKLGYYFCKAKNGIIDAETFVGKVMFYVWNDVYKDFAEEAGDLFKDKDGSILSFSKFYAVGADGKTIVVEDKVTLFLQNLKVPIEEETTDADDAEELSNESLGEGKHKYLQSVLFPDGTLFSSVQMTRFEVYLESLKKIGFNKVFPLIANMKYKRKGCPLMSLEEHQEILNSREYTYHQEGNFYIVKGANDDTLINVLAELNSQLDLGVEITYK